MEQDLQEIENLIMLSNHYVQNNLQVQFLTNYKRIFDKAAHFGAKRYESLDMAEYSFSPGLESVYQKIVKAPEFVQISREKIKIQNALVSEILATIFQVRQLKKVKPSHPVCENLQKVSGKVKKLITQVKQNQKICYFCGALLANTNINSDCLINRKDVQPYKCVQSLFFHPLNPP